MKTSHGNGLSLLPRKPWTPNPAFMSPPVSELAGPGAARVRGAAPGRAAALGGPVEPPKFPIESQAKPTIHQWLWVRNMVTPKWNLVNGNLDYHTQVKDNPSHK